jgi:hypothetical protein
MMQYNKDILEALNVVLNEETIEEAKFNPAYHTEVYKTIINLPEDSNVEPGDIVRSLNKDGVSPQFAATIEKRNGKAEIKIYVLNFSETSYKNAIEKAFGIKL